MGFHCRVILSCVNKIEVMYERPRLKVKVEPRVSYARTHMEITRLWIFILKVDFHCRVIFFVRTHVRYPRFNFYLYSRLSFFKEIPNTGVKAESPFVFVYLLILFTYGCGE